MGPMGNLVTNLPIFLGSVIIFTITTIKIIFTVALRL